MLGQRSMSFGHLSCAVCVHFLKSSSQVNLRIVSGGGSYGGRLADIFPLPVRPEISTLQDQVITLERFPNVFSPTKKQLMRLD